MTTTSKIVIGLAFIGAILGSLAFFGFSPFGRQVVNEVFGSPSGTTSTSVDGATVVVSMTNATSSSILNPTGQLAYVYLGLVNCTGVGTSQSLVTGGGLAALTLTAGTTSTATAPAGGFEFTTEILQGVTIGTSSPVFALASSTMQTATTSFATLWPAGTYMTFVSNATNTAVCTFGVGTFGS